MGLRLDLQALLVDLLGSNHVYFQPPPTIQMEYPCIVYERNFESAAFADNGPYRRMKRYKVTVIDPNPDSLIPDQVGALTLCRFDRFYTADNLNHDVYDLFF